MFAYLEVNRLHPMHQKSKGGNTVVQIVIIPQGVDRPKRLNRIKCKRLGIKIITIGYGWSYNRGPRSKLTKAIQEGKERLKQLREEMKCH